MVKFPVNFLPWNPIELYLIKFLLQSFIEIYLIKKKLNFHWKISLFIFKQQQKNSDVTIERYLLIVPFFSSHNRSFFSAHTLARTHKSSMNEFHDSSNKNKK